MQAGVWWVLGIMAFIPAGYGLALVLKDWLAARRTARQARPLKPCSVAEIAARIAREDAAQAEQVIRWPRVDTDRGTVCDERLTCTLPLVPGEPRCEIPAPLTNETPTVLHQRG